jgi:hypothetical protein
MAVDFQVAIDFAQTFLNEARSNLIRFREALAQTTANAEQTAADALSTSTGLATVLSTRDVILSKLDAVAAIASSIGIAHRWVGTILQIQDQDHEWVTGPDLRGIKGDKGDKGDTGQNGATWLEGTSDPSDDRPEGDLYVNTTTYNLFVSAGGGFWDQIGNIKGPQGGQGPQGAQGIKGDTGDTGPQGADGTDGTDGTNGTNGANGATWRTGSVAPSDSVGVDGDLYLNTATDDVYLRTAGTYSVVTNIKGSTGAAGTNGTNGTNGATWRDGSGAPSNSLGVDGDYYFDDVANDIYKRTAGTYAIVANNRGSSGSNGATWRSGPGAPSNALGVDGDFYFNQTNNDILKRGAGVYSVIANPTGPQGPTGPNSPINLNFVLDGAGSVVPTGVRGYISVDFNGTISLGTLLADQTGSIQVEIWKCTYAQFDAGATHPVSADKINASAPLTISSGVKSQDATLTGWTLTVNAGDVLAFNVVSATSITRCTVSLKLART